MNTENHELSKLLEEIEQYDIFFNIINRFIGHYTRQIQRISINDTDTEYPFVAMDTRQVFVQLDFARRYIETVQKKQMPCSFIDIGCGIGNILLFAEQLGFDVHGIEKDRFPRETASSLLDTDQIYDADIREFTGYDMFDVVYYFCPLTNGQRAFERHVEDTIKEGAILIANYKRDNRIETDRRFRKLHPALPVWEKQHA
jgi:2-polyprenyl-3-methyl-5-hydroxy-6-metoxy-1,4-benzoquinol methylase